MDIVKTSNMNHLYLEVSIAVETPDTRLLQPVSDLYGDTHIIRAVCQENVILPLLQIR